jgi:hypothetical protein
VKANPILVAVLAALPFGYVGFMMAIHAPVDWMVVVVLLPFMAFPFVAGLLLSKRGTNETTDVRRVVAAAPRHSRQESSGSKLAWRDAVADDNSAKPEPANRWAGVGLLFMALLVFGANEFMLRIMGRYFPLILAVTGPLIAVGALTLIHPRFFNALVGAKGTNEPKWVMRVALGALGVGVALSLFILFRTYYGPP